LIIGKRKLNDIVQPIETIRTAEELKSLFLQKTNNLRNVKARQSLLADKHRKYQLLNINQMYEYEVTNCNSSFKVRAFIEIFLPLSLFLVLSNLVKI
jgi:hypothetical protein